MEIKDRILQFIRYKGITKNRFEIECGLPKRYVSNIGESIQSNIIKKIILTYPEINLYWLVMGEGSMLVADSNDGNHMDLVAALKEHIAMLTRFNENLLGEVEELREDNMKQFKRGVG